MNVKWNKRGEFDKATPVIRKEPIYLLSHEIQSALQGVGNLDLSVAIVDLNASRAEGIKRPEHRGHVSQFTG